MKVLLEIDVEFNIMIIHHGKELGREETTFRAELSFPDLPREGDFIVFYSDPNCVPEDLAFNIIRKGEKENTLEIRGWNMPEGSHVSSIEWKPSARGVMKPVVYLNSISLEENCFIPSHTYDFVTAMIKNWLTGSDLSFSPFVY